MYRGDSYVFDVQVFGDDGCTPQNIAGWSVWFTMKFYTADPDSRAVAQLTSALGGGIVITNPSIGQARVTVPPSATALFPDGDVTLVYDVQVRDLLGNIATVERGSITVIPDVTRAIS